MPLPQLARTVQGRATAQAGGNTETRQATVKKTYGDGSGNILFADVRLPGQTADLVHVPNRTTLKLAVNDQVTLNFVQGQSHYPQIVGAAGGGTAAAANAQSAADSGANVPPVVPQDFSSAPVLLQAPTALAPSGYVEAPGANILFTDTPPGNTSGGAVNGQRLITMRPLVSASLPNPLTTTLPDGTLLDLVDSYSNPLGMYRLDAAAKVWRRRDVGSAGSTFTLLPATASTLGGVKIGANVTVAVDGTISVAFPVTSVAGRTGAVTLSTGDISGLGTAATYNVPATGNAAAGQVVLGSDTRLGNATRYWFLAGDSVTPPAANTTDPVYTFRLPKSPTGAALTYTFTDCNFHAAVSPSGGAASLDFYKNGVTILTTPLSIASASTDATDEVTFATATAVSGDVISVHYGTINGSDQWTWRLSASTSF